MILKEMLSSSVFTTIEFIRSQCGLKIINGYIEISPCAYTDCRKCLMFKHHKPHEDCHATFDRIIEKDVNEL